MTIQSYLVDVLPPLIYSPTEQPALTKSHIGRVHPGKTMDELLRQLFTPKFEAGIPRKDGLQCTMRVQFPRQVEAMEPSSRREHYPHAQ
jgi:hypothetical protein